MENYVVSLFVTLFICVFDGYCMMNYRLSAKKAYACFAAVSVVCFAVNAYIALHFGADALENVMIFTIGMPYFLLILFISSDKLSKTFFNFWLWINVYEIISNFSLFVNEISLKSHLFLTVFRCLMLVIYFVVYNKFFKKQHKMIMDSIDVNWWIFSFIPMFFTVLIINVNHIFYPERNYLILFIIHTLMILVYILIFYTFKTAYANFKTHQIEKNLKKQIELQKDRYELLKKQAQEQKIFRHDARHRNIVLMGFLQNGDIDAAKEFLHSELNIIQKSKQNEFCSDPLINAVVLKYAGLAKDKNVLFKCKITLPDNVLPDEAMFCVMLSNLLENSVEVAKKYVDLTIKNLNKQISVNVKNDCSEKIKKDKKGFYITTKPNGLGLGLKSVEAIVKKGGGFIKISDSGNIFEVMLTVKSR